MRLKVALPSECNDPFEFTPSSRATLTRQYLLEKWKNDPSHFRPVYDQMVADGFLQPFCEFLRFLPAQITRIFPRILKLHQAALIEDDLRSRDQASEVAGVLCLSARNESIPMWSHYADMHRGVVIGIKARDSTFSQAIHRRVRYLKRRRVSVDPFATVGTKKWWEQINRTIFSKSQEWDYEQEYRILFSLKDLVRGKLDDGRAAHFVDVSGSTIDCLVFGCLVPPEDEASIRQLLSSKKRFAGVKRFRAQRHRRWFTLEIVAGT